MKTTSPKPCAQAFVDQTPKFDKTVLSRKAGILRPRKSTKKTKWI